VYEEFNYLSANIWSSSEAHKRIIKSRVNKNELFKRYFDKIGEDRIDSIPEEQEFPEEVC
jgi:hypothetical protein